MTDRDLKTCARKVKYPNRRSAGIAAHKMANKDTFPPSPYRCPVCDKWHLGHAPAQRVWNLIDKAVS